jgi:cytochrome b subunit of formate dehydrogenase
MRSFVRGALRSCPVLALISFLVWAAQPATAQEAEAAACTDCHDGVQPADLEKTVHAGLSCTDCHIGAEKDPHPEGVANVDCSTCHPDTVEELQKSIHGKPVFTQISGKPACQTCHGPVHQIVSRDDPASRVSPARVAMTCAQCHASPEIAKRTGLHLVQPLAAYNASVHARAIREGKPAADCASCHGSHGILPASDPASKVNHQNVPGTCGECHGEIAKAFAASVHGQAAARGVREAPVCTDCHGEHRILAPSDPGSPVFATNLPKMTCGRCHGDLRISQKYGMPSDVVASFDDSYHGLAGRSGSQTVANCASCHGVHNIFPSADPRSTVNKANLSKTCGNCHPGAGTRFAMGPVHLVSTDQASSPAVYWVRLIYLWLIWLVIGGMVLHNALDMRRKVLSPVRLPIVPVSERRPRMRAGFRIAHALTMASFIVLAYTGFALKFPGAWWSRPLLAWEETVALRGAIHRMAAVVMVAAFLGHFVHLAVSKEARACIFRMWPSLHDVRELREKLAWYFGKRAEMPRSPTLSYVEKAEYLALMWGTAVMAFTGFLLWFENLTLTWLPKWAIDISTAVHFYEAVLATLAILVWHFYFVIFDPLVYPMDTAWLTGREVPGRTIERNE